MTIEIRQPELEALEEIHRRRLFEWLEQTGPGWNPELHDELARGAAQWVEMLRRTDEEIDSAATH